MAIEGLGVDVFLEELYLTGECGNNPIENANTSKFSWKMDEVAAHGRDNIEPMKDLDDDWALDHIDGFG